MIGVNKATFQKLPNLTDLFQEKHREVPQSYHKKNGQDTQQLTMKKIRSKKIRFLAESNMIKSSR